MMVDVGRIVDRVHRPVVHARRVRVLAEHLAAILPTNARVADIGAGDGKLDAALMTLRPDLSIRAFEVLPRPDVAFPVEPFDGKSVPLPDGAVDIALFVDVLHHASDPMALLQEAKRISNAIVIKDHTRNGWLARQTLTAMDWVGNKRFGVSLIYAYWSRREWDEAFNRLRLRVESWNARLGLYPLPFRWIFERSLHFLAYVRA